MIFDASLVEADLDIYKLTGTMSAETVHELYNLARAIILTHYRNKGDYDYDDMVQEGVLRCMQALTTYDRKRGGLHNYLTTVIRNKCVDMLRRSSYRAAHTDNVDVMVDACTDAEEADDGTEFRLIAHARKVYTGMTAPDWNVAAAACRAVRNNYSRCLELMLRRFPSLPADAVHEAFELVYDGLLRGTHTPDAALRAMRVLHVHATHKVLVRNVSLALIRLCALEYIVLAEHVYANIKPSEEFTLTPELRVLRMVADESDAIRLLTALLESC